MAPLLKDFGGPLLPFCDCPNCPPPFAPSPYPSFSAAFSVFGTTAFPFAPSLNAVERTAQNTVFYFHPIFSIQNFVPGTAIPEKKGN
jgi:hypothetical protein